MFPLTNNDHSSKQDGRPEVDRQVVAGDGENATNVLGQIQHSIVVTNSFQGTWEGDVKFFSANQLGLTEDPEGHVGDTL